VRIEHRWWLDDVVIDAHKNHVIGIHTNSLRSADQFLTAVSRTDRTGSVVLRPHDLQIGEPPASDTASQVPPVRPPMQVLRALTTLVPLVTLGYLDGAI
jgi:hypothetical protein